MKNRREDIQALVQALGKGSVKAFDSLYVMFSPKVKRVAGIIVGGGNLQSINDITQAVFLKLWERRVVVAERVRDFDSYLFMMTRNEALNYLTRVVRHYEDLHPDMPIYSDDDILPEVEAGETSAQIRRTVDGMPQQRRTAFILSRIDGLTYKEIADRMGISSKTVEKHISQSLKDIKKTLS